MEISKSDLQVNCRRSWFSWQVDSSGEFGFSSRSGSVPPDENRLYRMGWGQSHFLDFLFACHLTLLGSNPFSLESRRISWSTTRVSKWGHLRYLMEMLIKPGMEVAFPIFRQPILACIVFWFSVTTSFRRSAQNSFPSAQVVWYMHQLHIIATLGGWIPWCHVQDGPTRVLGATGDVIFTYFF